MASAKPPSKSSSAFEHQRAALCAEISLSMEHVLQNLNTLNRGLEGVIAVGNEFGAVEALWSQFENVMAKEEGEAEERGEDGEEEDGNGEGEK